MLNGNGREQQPVIKYSYDKQHHIAEEYTLHTIVFHLKTALVYANISIYNTISLCGAVHFEKG